MWRAPDAETDAVASVGLFDVGYRKVRSGTRTLASGLWCHAARIFWRVWEPSVRMGKGVKIGRGVRFYVSCGGSVWLGHRVILQDDVVIYADQGTVRIGDETFVGRGSEIVAKGTVSIGRDTLIAARCVIRDADHCFADPDIPIRLQGHTTRPVLIGDDVWLGANVVVTAGASIGRGSVIGANAVVRGALPAYCVAAGVPAHVVKGRGRPIVSENGGPVVVGGSSDAEGRE